MAQVQLTDPKIGETYQRIISSDPDVDYMLLSYVGVTNNLKVQDQGTGGLEELQESWNDGRIQFGFVRIKDAISSLTKFVLICWCGDGVLEVRKGLFHSHASTVAQFLKGYHVQINARCDTDVEPSQILKKVADSSGAKYSIHNEKPVKRELPAPVGTNYTPIGRPDIAAMTSKQKPTPPAPVGTSYTPMRNELAEIRATRTAPSVAPVLARAPLSNPAYEDEFEPTIKASSTPPPPVVPIRHAAIKPNNESTFDNSQNDGRPGYVGTTYTPVSLGKPGKLGNRLSAFSAPREEVKPVTSAVGGGKKMTWAERQAQAKNQMAQEEARSRAAIERSTHSIKRIPLGSSAPPVVALSRPLAEAEDEFETPSRGPKLADDEPAPSSAPSPPAPPPPPPPPPPAPEASQLPSHTTRQEHINPAPPSPPPAPPAPSPPPMAGAAFGAQLADREADRAVEQAAQAEMALRQKMDALAIASDQVDAAVASQGLRAVVAYEYEKAEDNEIDLIEGEIIENIEMIDEGWWSGTGANGSKQGLFPSNYVELLDETPQVAAPPPVPLPPPASEPLPIDKGIYAVAMYEYEAGEDNEISFQEGEEITQIEYSSEDWWTGTVKSGNRGLFPANYVELQEL
ncbi:hypothetical protein O181_057353 [Austropuccinia psidii MF-1]|uniref:Drebrin-like protein n=1 Tax=Austropuccinia psidii MF-1 TaxID=1389203 RepID=A0A9Q3EB65_9BASI|nr:hypothetical protein [Austropuccinia psidii MF-1]